MEVEVMINGSTRPSARYVTWSASPCSIRISNPSGLIAPLTVTLSNRTIANGGAITFRTTPTGTASATLSLTLPLNGNSVPFFISGIFGRPSRADRDTFLRVRRGLTTLLEVPLMVRIRKNANALTTSERDRFVTAMAKLNNQGAGRFADFRNMHVDASVDEAHQAPGFLPWHRAYLLDLERELQAIDPSVALPYWRFDQAAPNLFTVDFIGASNSLGTVQFGSGNPLRFWVTDGVPGVTRRPQFNPGTQGAFVISEADTFALGSTYETFQVMEGNPHGSAHTSFGGLISSLGTAARDPLFFLLHCNVDRLWAKWQKRNSRFNPTQAASYDSNLPGGNRIGHNLADTMWPWNGVTTNPRPATAPGGTLAASPTAAAPGPQPTVRNCIDYRGVVSAARRMGFDYDDVRFA